MSFDIIIHNGTIVTVNPDFDIIEDGIVCIKKGRLERIEPRRAGSLIPEANEIIKFQIQGYDEGNNSPNNTIYRSIDLNISTNLGWYYQDFSSDPITLPVGNYSLVMNGTNLPINAYAKYFWTIDDRILKFHS